MADPQRPSFVDHDAAIGTTFEWFDPPFRPSEGVLDQAYAACVTAEGDLVLVHDGAYGWNLPGGGIELGESPEEALVREVAEEVCARVIDFEPIGWQRVTHHEGRRLVQRPWHQETTYWQARYWALVELQPWEPQHEIVERRLVAPSDFRGTLRWGSARSAERILANAREAHLRRGFVWKDTPSGDAPGTQSDRSVS